MTKEEFEKSEVDEIAQLRHNLSVERGYYQSHLFNISLPIQLETTGLRTIGNFAYWGQEIEIPEIFTQYRASTFSENDQYAGKELIFPIYGVKNFQAFESAVSQFETLVSKTETDLKDYIEDNLQKFKKIILLKSSGDEIGYFEQIYGSDNGLLKEIKKMISEKNELEKKVFKSDLDKRNISFLESEITEKIENLRSVYYYNQIFQKIYAMFNKIGIKTTYMTEWYKFDLDFSSEENLERSIQNLYSMFEKLKEIIKKIEIQIQQVKEDSKMDLILSEMSKNELEMIKLTTPTTDIYGSEKNSLEQLDNLTVTAKKSDLLDRVSEETQTQSDIGEVELSDISPEELRRLKEQIITSLMKSYELKDSTNYTDYSDLIESTGKKR